MKAISRRLTCAFVAVVILLANMPAEAPLSATKRTDAPEPGVLSDTAPPSLIPSPDHTRAPMMFIENVGQFAKGARFQVRGGDRTIWLSEDAIWVTVFGIPSSPQTLSPNPGKERIVLPSPEFARGDQKPAGESELRQGVNLKLSFVSANPHPRLEPFNRLDTHVSHFVGNDPDKWRPDVPVWGGVRYVDLYPGVDLELTGESGQWHWQLAVRDASPLTLSEAGREAGHHSIRLRVEGADTMTLDNDCLRLTTAAGEFSLPLLQASDATPARPTLIGDQVTSPFAAAVRAPQSAHLAQNPQSGTADLLFSTFLGGGESEEVKGGIAVDGSGAAYVTGNTGSPNFPTTPGAFDTTHKETYWDAYVVKLNAGGSTLAYATFLGGNAHDYGMGIAVDGSGAAYITGWTESTDFPTTPGAFDTTHGGGGYDAYVVKLNAAGSTLAYATLLGGSSTDEGNGIAVDGSGAAYVAGYTQSSNFPTTPGAFDRTLSGGSNAFVVKLNVAGSALTYATFLGGSSGDNGYDIAVDGSGAAYVTGHTFSSDFPVTAGTSDTTLNGNSDAFVAKVNPAGSALTYATFLGGTNYQWGDDIAVDGSGAAYVTGITASSDFPTTPGAFDTTRNGGAYDAFVAKLNAAGSALAYATFLGGSDFDQGLGIAVDKNGAAYIGGWTGSPDFPTTPGAFDTTFNGGSDAFVVKLNSVGSALAYATFLGGSSGDPVRGIAIDGNRDAYVTGSTSSTDFPTTPGAFDTTHNGGVIDAFVVKLAMGSKAPTILKQVTPGGPRAVNFGDWITYTIQVITPTTGVLAFYDRVPTFTAYLADSLNAPASVAFDSPSNAISGTLNLTDFVPLTVSFAVRVEVTGTVDSAPLIANRACVRPIGTGLANCLWSNEVWNFTYIWANYLPIILRNP